MPQYPSYESPQQQEYFCNCGIWASANEISAKSVKGLSRGIWLPHSSWLCEGHSPFPQTLQLSDAVVAYVCPILTEKACDRCYNNKDVVLNSALSYLFGP